ncbi:MAG: hypothetical protein LC734_02220 [Acidobacteria bacterium]|nr:hypothetical protein [Acidobacteriota bacterium]
MEDRVSKYDVTARDLSRGRNLRIAAFASPIVLAAIPAIVFAALFFIFGTAPPAAATILFLGLVLTAIGFFAGLALSGYFAYRLSNWTKDMRERIAADGIRAEEIDWFRHELSSSEKRALNEIEKSDILLGDAYRETLASRLTASRIIRSSRRELDLTRRRLSKLKKLKSESAATMLEAVKVDETKLRSINDEANEMLVEAESRLHMIEAAAMRGSSIADSEIALKKLSARAKDLPLALEQAKISNEIRLEIESEEQP